MRLRSVGDYGFCILTTPNFALLIKNVTVVSPESLFGLRGVENAEHLPVKSDDSTPFCRVAFTRVKDYK